MKTLILNNLSCLMISKLYFIILFVLLILTFNGFSQDYEFPKTYSFDDRNFNFLWIHKVNTGKGRGYIKLDYENKFEYFKGTGCVAFTDIVLIKGKYKKHKNQIILYDENNQKIKRLKICGKILKEKYLIFTIKKFKCD